jgi:adenosylhomocysteine nucleosidase
MNRTVLVVAALGWEAREIVRCINGLQVSREGDVGLWRARGADVWVLKTGVGPEHARRALAWTAGTVEPQIVISTGCGGALASELSIGDLAIADEVVTSDGRSIATASSWRERYRRAGAAAGVNVRSGRLLSLGGIVATAHEKQRLARESRAIAVEMEASAIGEWAMAAGREFAASRVILDPAEMSLAPEIGWMMTPAGSISLRKLVFAVARKPRLVSELVSLGAAARRCRAALASVHRELLRNLEGEGLLRNDEASAKTSA